MMTSGVQLRCSNWAVSAFFITAPYYLLRTLFWVEGSTHAKAQSESGQSLEFPGQEVQKVEASVNGAGVTWAGLPVYQAYKRTDRGVLQAQTDVSPGGFGKGFLMTVEERLGVGLINESSYKTVSGAQLSNVEVQRKVVAGPGEEGGAGYKSYSGRRVPKNWYLEGGGLGHGSCGILEA